MAKKKPYQHLRLDDHRKLCCFWPRTLRSHHRLKRKNRQTQVTHSEARLTLEDTLPVADAKLSDDCSCSAALNCLKIEPIESVPTARQPRLQKSIRSSIVRVFPAVFVLVFKAQLSLWHLPLHGTLADGHWSYHVSVCSLPTLRQCVNFQKASFLKETLEGGIYKMTTESSKQEKNDRQRINVSVRSFTQT